MVAVIGPMLFCTKVSLYIFYGIETEMIDYTFSSRPSVMDGSNHPKLVHS